MCFPLPKHSDQHCQRQHYSPGGRALHNLPKDAQVTSKPKSGTVGPVYESNMLPQVMVSEIPASDEKAEICSSGRSLSKDRSTGRKGCFDI